MRPAVSVHSTTKNLTKPERAARKVAEAITNQKPAKPPESFYKLTKIELEIFEKVRDYNEYFSDGDSMALSDLARAFIQREKVFKKLKSFTPADLEYKEFMKAHRYWDEIIQHNMKLLAISLNDRYKLAYDMSKIIQANMPKETETKEIETDPVLQLLEQI